MNQVTIDTDKLKEVFINAVRSADSQEEDFVIREIAKKIENEIGVIFFSKQ